MLTMKLQSKKFEICADLNIKMNRPKFIAKKGTLKSESVA
jgi:hypothetical protein